MQRYSGYVLACLTLLLLLSSLISCSKTDDAPDNTIVIGVRSNVGPLDPAIAPGPEQLQILHPVYQNLVRISVDAETGQDRFTPELASAWQISEDRLTWSFDLSDGHFFDDGSPVNSDAIKFTFDRLIAIGRAPSSSLRNVLASIETDGPRRIHFKLKRPLPSLLPLVADRSTFIINPTIMKHEIEGDHASQWLSTNSAGSGPYRLVRYSARDVYILEPNPHTTNAPKQIQRIVYRVSTDASIRALQMRNQDMDIAYFLPAETLRQFENTKQFEVSIIPGPAVNYLAFNMEVELLQDRRLRLAIAQAIDYAAIVEELKYNLAERYDGPLMPGMPGYTADAYPYAFDYAKATELISKIQDENSLPTLELIYPGVSAEADTMAIFLQSSLGNIGLDIKLQRLTVPALIDRIQRGNYDLVFMGWVAAYGDPSNLVNFWFDPNKIGAAGNYARYDNPAVSALLSASLSEQDKQTRTSQLKEIVRLTNEDIAYIYLVKNAVWAVSNTRLQGLNFDHYTLFDQPFEELTLSGNLPQ